MLNYVNTGYAGGGWDHYDPDLAPIYWPIEEATWLRCVRNSKLLKTEILDFLKYLQLKLGFETDIEIIEDLVQFQVFILSTMDNKESVKTFSAKYAWKDFLVNGNTSLDELNCCPKEYSWKNKVTESGTAEWCYKAIWVGRNQCNYKCHPEMLLE